MSTKDQRFRNKTFPKVEIINFYFYLNYLKTDKIKVDVILNQVSNVQQHIIWKQENM